jgi:proteasome component ECM29
VIMLVLSLIRCDPTFGRENTLMIYNMYKAPTITIEESRTRALIPMLFMAKHDPVATVKEVMKGVWAKLIAEPEPSIIISNLDRIMRYLIDNLMNPRWREREAACVALDVVLLNRSWDAVKCYACSLLTKGFHVMDDLRESTRKAAAIFMKTLLAQVLIASDSNEVTEETASATVGLALPLLLDVGMLSPSMEARGFTLGAIVKIVQQAKQSLFPWLEKLIDTLLESISALEPQLMQYMQFHVQAMQVSSEEWESKRMQLSQHSPMHEALQQCLELVPFEQMPAICSVIYRHLNVGVGLPTRVAAANAFSYLVEKFPAGMSRTGIKTFQLVCQTLFDKPNLSSSLRKAMVHALGMLAKV